MYLLSITATACKLYYNLMNKKKHFNTYLLSWGSAVRDCWFPTTAETQIKRPNIAIN